jgi:hypothetical protein
MHANVKIFPFPIQYMLRLLFIWCKMKLHLVMFEKSRLDIFYFNAKYYF